MFKKNIYKIGLTALAAGMSIGLAGCFGGETNNNGTEAPKAEEHQTPTQPAVETEGFTEKTLDKIAKEDADNGIWIEYNENSSFVASDADDNQFILADNKVSVDENIDVKIIEDGDKKYFYLVTGSFSMFRGDVNDITVWNYVNGKPMSRTQINSLKGNKIALLDNRGGIVLDGENTELDMKIWPYLYTSDNQDNSDRFFHIMASTGGQSNVYLVNQSEYGEIMCFTSDADPKLFSNVKINNSTGETIIQDGQGSSYTFEYGSGLAGEGSTLDEVLNGEEPETEEETEPETEEETKSEVNTDLSDPGSGNASDE